VLLSLGVVIFSSHIYCIILYNASLNLLHVDMFAAILVTNLAEVVEYIKTYFDVKKVVVVAVFVVLLLSLFFMMRNKAIKFNIVSQTILFFMIMLSGYVVVNNFDAVINLNLYKVFHNSVPDLRDYRQSPEVVTHGERPDYVVLLIGESFTKTHSSLYGYEKETNPMLGKMLQDSVLAVFDKACSYATHTTPSIKSLMSSYTNDYADSIRWYECLNIIDVMKSAGFETWWLSNQSKKGIADNEVGRYADLCDRNLFVGDIYAGTNRSSVDEELLPFVNECLLDDTQNKFVVVHMMGSHPQYVARYPKAFSGFMPQDYDKSHPQLTLDNRKIVSEYDNSILYNDSVVYEIMQRFYNETAVLIYLSDHGEDIFDSSNDYAGHAKVNNPVSRKAGVEVPLMVYTTPLFREKHPQLQERIERSVSTPYRTDSIMYTIMDVAGVETVNGVSYKHKSLFR
ncbi:MAG: phosphoethanolamine transferase, partial [Bacteroidales bacterium]|nr:phosphoethanolamine transferase [Bacteroidales bacterium]